MVLWQTNFEKDDIRLVILKRETDLKFSVITSVKVSNNESPFWVMMYGKNSVAAWVEMGGLVHGTLRTLFLNALLFFIYIY